jgi:hypothetical protein
MNCRTDFTPKRREGYGRFWVCKDHPWQKFPVGSAIITLQPRPKTIEETREDVAIKAPFQAKNRPKGHSHVRA